MLKEYINKASRFELTEASDRIYGVLESVLGGVAKPCSAREELAAICKSIDAEIEQRMAPPSEESVKMLHPCFDEE